MSSNSRKRSSILLIVVGVLITTPRVSVALRNFWYIVRSILEARSNDSV